MEVRSPCAAIDVCVVNDYAQDLLDGAAFPPVIAFYDGNVHIACRRFSSPPVWPDKQASITTISTDVRQGTCRDALLYSVSANASHGMCLEQ